MTLNFQKNKNNNFISDIGRWVYKDNSQIYSNIVWLMDEKDANKYHLIDDNGKEININIKEHIVNEQ